MNYVGYLIIICNNIKWLQIMPFPSLHLSSSYFLHSNPPVRFPSIQLFFFFGSYCYQCIRIITCILALFYTQPLPLLSIPSTYMNDCVCMCVGLYDDRTTDALFPYCCNVKVMARNDTILAVSAHSV